MVEMAEFDAELWEMAFNGAYEFLFQGGGHEDDKGGVDHVDADKDENLTRTMYNFYKKALMRPWTITLADVDPSIISKFSIETYTKLCEQHILHLLNAFQVHDNNPARNAQIKKEIIDAFNVRFSKLKQKTMSFEALLEKGKEYKGGRRRRSPIQKTQKKAPQKQKTTAKRKTSASSTRNKAPQKQKTQTTKKPAQKKSQVSRVSKK
jgi:hypothetical protein